MYIELKSGYNDNGPAWIGRAKFSKSGQTIYFNNKALKKYNSYCGNYIDVETGELYWTSGVKKNECDRHWAGSGKIMIDRTAVDEYLRLIDKTSLDENRYKLVDIQNEYPIDRINKMENYKTK